MSTLNDNPTCKSWNLACFQTTRAEVHFKYKRYDEAIQCHNNAALLLLLVLKDVMTSPQKLGVVLDQYRDEILQTYLVRHQKNMALIKLSEEQDLKTVHICDAIFNKDMCKLLNGIRIYTRESLSLFKLVIEKLNSNDMDGLSDHNADITKAPTRKIVAFLQIRNQILIATVRRFLMTFELHMLDNTVLKDRIEYLKLLKPKVSPQPEQEEQPA